MSGFWNDWIEERYDEGIITSAGISFTINITRDYDYISFCLSQD